MRIQVLFCVCMLPLVAWGQNRKPQGAWYVDGAVVKFENRSHTSLEAYDQGSSVIYATNGVDLILTELRMNKTSGGIVDEHRRETGLNSALLADGGSKVRVERCTVTSHAPQADGITGSGEGTRLVLTLGTVTTNRMASAGITSVNGAEIVVSGTNVNTIDHQSAGFYTLNGGKIDITEAQIQNGGQASPMFHSSGIINALKCRGGSAKWTVGNVENGELTITKSELKAGGISGFLLYSTSKNSDVKSRLNLIKNSISVAEGPIFLVTNNQDAQITLQGNKISCKGGLIEVRHDEWGQKGANGGHAALIVNKQTIQGDVLVDSISSLDLILNKGAKVTAQVNKEENREAKVHVKLNAGAKWTSKGDSYLTSIEFGQPLEKGLKQLKGKHTIYYDPADPANAPLGGKEYKTGGGKLCPMK